jgi:hypothetical protein
MQRTARRLHVTMPVHGGLTTAAAVKADVVAGVREGSH